MLFHFTTIIAIHHVLFLKVTASTPLNCLTTGDVITVGFKTCSDISPSGSTCCAQGDACLDTGLCFGNDGVLSRGACVNSFMTSTCLTFCDSVFSPPKQHVPCSAWVRENTTQHYWCGTNAEAICNVANSSFIQFAPGKGNRVPGTGFESKNPSSPTSSISSSILSSSTAIMVAESSTSFTSTVELPTSTSSIEQTITASEISTTAEERQQVTPIPALSNILPNIYQLPDELPYYNPDEDPEEYFKPLQTHPERSYYMRYLYVCLGILVFACLVVYLHERRRGNRRRSEIHAGDLEKLRYSPIQRNVRAFEKGKGRGNIGSAT